MGDGSTMLYDLIASSQHNRLLRLSFPNDDGPSSMMLVNQIDAFESLSRPFEFTVELLSGDPHIELKALQGKLISVALVCGDGSMRYFSGHVFAFRLKRVDGNLSYYEAKLGPWYRYLGLRKDNYLFHYTTLYQQTGSIFGDYAPLADWDWRVQGATNVMTDCCQYGESDSNFLERRWVAAGIYYWFEHKAGGHQLVLSDDSTAAEAIDGGPDVPFQRHGGAQEEDGIAEWSPRRQIVQGSVALASYDFKSAKPKLASLPTLNQQGDVLAVESYEYTGALGFTGETERALSQLRMEEIEAGGKQFDGTGNNRHLMPGRWFRLTGHFDASDLGDDSDAREFLVTEVHHTATNNYHVSSTAPSHYENAFTCVRKSIPFRSGRDKNSVETKIHGIQTATVVGPAGEEIHTDEYGRVRVQFHWDRVGESDEKSSAWLRVATPWSGANFGMTTIPRIGTEVLVQFMDGNPDRPIITGMVPNVDTMPPWPLPANKTQSGILSRSTPGGTYDTANALRFEDKKGSEQLWLHAERDQLTEVEHDEDKWVGNDRRKVIDRDEMNHIKRDRTEIVDRDETITIHHDRLETVDHDETITVHNNRKERVDHNEDVAIGDNQTLNVGANRTKTIGKNEKDRIGKNWSVNVGKVKTETIGMAYMQNVGMGRMENVGMGYSLNVGMTMSTVVGWNQSEKVVKKKTVDVGDEFLVKVGKRFTVEVGKTIIELKADGSVAITGETINITAQSGDTTINGEKVWINPIGGGPAVQPGAAQLTGLDELKVCTSF